MACLLLVLARTAAAGEYQYTLSYSADYSNNIGLAPTDEQDELIHVLDSNFILSQESRELDARAAARATYRDYQKNTFADQTTLGLDSEVTWKPLPESFQWVATDVYTQVAASPTLADTPANRLNTNVFSTGPDVFWRPDPVNTVQLGARYGSNTFSGTDNASLADDADNTRRTGTIAWSYRYSPVTTLSIGHSTESVRFSNPGIGTNFDFRTNQTTAGLVSQRETNTFALDAGETRLKRTGQPEIHGKLGRLSWKRQLSSDSAFSIIAARSLSDTAGQLLAGSGGTTPIGAPLALSTSDVFTSKTATVLYSRGFGRGSLTLSAFRAERVFELSTADNDDARGATIQYTRSFSERLTSAAKFNYVRTLFPTITREDEDKAGTISLQYKLTHTLFGGVSVSRRIRQSTDPTAAFAENRVVLSLAYNSIPIRW